MDRRRDGSRSTWDSLLALLKGLGADFRPRSFADRAYRTGIKSHLGSADRGGIAVGRDVSRRTRYCRQPGFSLSTAGASKNLTLFARRTVILPFARLLDTNRSS